MHSWLAMKQLWVAFWVQALDATQVSLFSTFASERDCVSCEGVMRSLHVYEIIVDLSTTQTWRCTGVRPYLS